MRRDIVLSALCALWLCAGCQNSGAPLPANMPQAPCVCLSGDAAGMPSCQVAYQDPEICPDLSPVQFCSRYVGASVGTDVLLINRGLSGLRIKSITLIGDDHCSFAPPELAPGFQTGDSGTVIGYMASTAIHLQYSPTQIAPDYTLLRIESDAENFPRLDIAVCGQGIMPGTPASMDGGTCLPCVKPSSDKPACGKANGGM